MGSSPSALRSETNDSKLSFDQSSRDDHSSSYSMPEDTQQQPASTKNSKKKTISSNNNNHNLSGVALVEFKCRKKKKAWSRCVGTYYNRFSSGKVLEEEEADCDDLFEQFRLCYLRGMLKEREKRGLEKPKEGTLLAEFVEEEGIYKPKN